MPGGAGGAALPVPDTTALVKGSADATKQVRIEAGALAAGNRTLTIGAGAQTADRSIALPVVAADDTLASRGTANVFTRGQAVHGSADETQLTVRANAAQTVPLETWQASDGTPKGWVGQNAFCRGNDLNTRTLEMAATRVSFGSTGAVTWAPNSAYANEGDLGNVADTGLARAAAGVVKPTNGSTGGGVLELVQVAAGGTPGANAARLYALDNGGTAELYVKDEAGNETQISPHAADSPGAAADAGAPGVPVVLKHRNAYAGREEWIHLSALAREVERLSGKTFVFSREMPRADWEADQRARQAAWDTQRAGELALRQAWEAQPPELRAAGTAPAVREARAIRKPPPHWLKT